MKRRNGLTARIAIRLPQSVRDKLNTWPGDKDLPLANMVCALVRQAATAHSKRTSW